MSSISFFKLQQKLDLHMVQDFIEADYYTKEKKSLYWGRLAQVIQKFDQIMEIEKKQIQQMIGEILDKKTKYLDAFIKFKFSLKTQYQNKGLEFIIIEHEKIHKFFQTQLNQILEIISFFIHNPEKLSQVLNIYSDYRRKFQFNDFLLNVVNLYYNFYYLYEKLKVDQQSEFFRFIDSIFKDWDYDIQNYRMKSNSIHNDILLAIFKNPIAESYIQKIAIQFIQKLQDCKVPFVFDLETIQKQLESKRITQKSFAEYKPKGLFTRIKQKFSSKTDEKVIYGKLQSSKFNSSIKSQINYTEYESNNLSQAQMIKRQRQQQFIRILKYSIQLILREELPPICKLLIRKFKKKLDNQNMKKSLDFQYYKQFCNILMTNWILSELHYKFTLSHDQKQMSNTELLNISELLRAITYVFQQFIDTSDKNIFYAEIIHYYRQKVQDFYQNLISSDIFVIKQTQISTYLIKYQHCLKFFSFNDIRIFYDIIKTAQTKGVILNLSPAVYEFIKKPNLMYTSKNKIKFRQKQYQGQNIYFVYKIKQIQIINQIQTFYLGKQYPLNQLPQLTQILLKNADGIKIDDSLKIAKTLEFIKKMNSKQLIKNMSKLQQNFKNLQIRESEILNQQFNNSFNIQIKRNLVNKSQLIRHKQNICTEIQVSIDVINIYRKKMKSQIFYKNVTNNYIALVPIKIYVGIENGVLSAHKYFPETGKKLHISNIIMSKKNHKETIQKQSRIKNNLLNESYKLFQNIQKVIQWIAQIQLTKKAFYYGKKIEEFNIFFKNFCSLIDEYVPGYIQSQKYLQHLDVNKFKILIHERIGQILLIHLKLINVDKKRQSQIGLTFLMNELRLSQKDLINRSGLRGNRNSNPINSISIIQKDKIFLKRIQDINERQFYKRQLQDLNLEQFLFNQAITKFNNLEQKTTAKQKLQQFDNLIKMIFSIISLSISRQKITAQIINPIIQYVILKSKSKSYYKNLYIIQGLLTQSNVQTSYILTLWSSSLSYLSTLKSQGYS